MKLKTCLTILCLIFSFSSLYGYDAKALYQTLSEIESGKVDINSTVEIDSLSYDVVDGKFTLYSGLLAPLKTVLDSTKQTIGFYFTGEGKFIFKPPVKMERE